MTRKVKRRGIGASFGTEDCTKHTRIASHTRKAVTENDPFLEKFQGQIMKISKGYRSNRDLHIYYELEGAKSDKGIPYSFLREWLDIV